MLRTTCLFAVLTFLACEEGPLPRAIAPDLVRPGRLVGRVLVDGAPAVGARVDLPLAGVSSVAGDDGRFLVTGVPQGSLQVVASLEGPVGRLSAATSAAVFSGQDTDVGDVPLAATGAARGRLVTGRADGNAGG